ncbi:MAG: hypothetical protein EBZ78_05330, partial [Verrucomicrobia bacterium]|nr:hypothetical protein [Verrucomicrobiota bacterium]
MRLIWILGDQLLPSHPLLASPEPDLLVGMIESAPRATHLRYHQQKLTLLYSAMRHYAADLKKRKFHMLYHQLSDSPVGADYSAVLAGWMREHRIREIHLLDPNEYDTLHALPALSKKIGVPIQTHRSPQFLVSREEFSDWA